MSSLGRCCPARFGPFRTVKKALKTTEFEFGKAMQEHPLFKGQPPSERRQSGRRFILKLVSMGHPRLDRAEFHDRLGARPGYWQWGEEEKKHRVGSSAVVKALPVLFLTYLEATLTGHTTSFSFCGSRTGSPAASIGNAISQNSNRIHNLFADYSTGRRVSRIGLIFDGDNLNGKNKLNPNRCITFRAGQLPVDCIEVHLDYQLLTQPRQIIELSRRLRKNLGFELPAEFKEQSPEPSQRGPVATPEPAPKPPAQTTPPNHTDTPESEPKSAPEKPEPTHATTKETFPPTGAVRIPQELFNIYYNEEDVWEDDQPLIDLGLGDEVGDDTWKVKDACRSLLILGAPGSGKTSGSGFMFGGAFLQAGFGGLVLAAKPDECVRWVRLCDHFGRLGDCILIGEDLKYRISILDYEAQRPSDRASLADDLVAFLQDISQITSKSKGSHARERFWEDAPRRMMNRLMETFLLAGDRLDINVMQRFVTEAATVTRENWRRNPISEVLARAERNLKTEADRIEFQRCLDYWTIHFAGVIPDLTRGGIFESFASMADVLGSRGVRESLCVETTFTPECILSGKIAIVCWPTKGSDKSNLVIQTAWKHLFQRAVERRVDKGSIHARPVFLWEDEAHLFFNEKDGDWQSTARDCRAAHVMLSQNLNNFYQHGHNHHSVNAVFGSIGTHVFHANNDLDTNEWISNRLGKVLRSRRSSSTSTSYEKDATPPSHQATAGKGEAWEPAVWPNEFEALRMGGDGTCQALVHWLGHSFACNEGRSWRIVEIQQDSINYKQQP